MYHGSFSNQSGAFYNSFTMLPTNYLSEAELFTNAKGISISYEKTPDNFYYSSRGSQSGSTFTVTSSSQGIEDGGSLKTKTIIGTFSCKLYSYDNPADIINITNGTYKIILREQY